MDIWFHVAAIPAVFLLGLSKGGFSGVGMVAMPILVLACAPAEAAAILLPILVMQDMVGVVAYRHSWDWKNLAILLPGAFVGVLLGYRFASLVPESGICLAVGLISVLFGARRLLVERRVDAAPPVARPRVLWGMICGAGSGFTSMIAHAGAPPFQIFVMPQRLERDVFIGTGVIYFAVVNLMKVPPFIALGQVSARTLMVSATLAPLAFVSTWLGIHIARRMAVTRFFTVVYLLMILIGAKLVFDGLAGL